MALDFPLKEIDKSGEGTDYMVTVPKGSLWLTQNQTDCFIPVLSVPFILDIGVHQMFRAFVLLG